MSVTAGTTPRARTAEQPLFILGAPRSGTSLLYKALCLHGEAAWISNYVRRFPAVPALAAANRLAVGTPARRRAVWFGRDGGNAYVYATRRSHLDRLYPMPVEGEPVFAASGVPEGAAEAGELSDAQAGALQRSFAAVLRFGGGSVVVSKRIANNRRVPLLAGVFPGARFVELVRDGRAVAWSLSQVDWWDDDVVWWYGGTPSQWRAEGRDPWELCARHWIEELGEVERGLARVPAGQSLRISYEDLVARPVDVLRTVAAFASLGPDASWIAELERLRFPNRNETWRERLDPAAVATVEAVQAGALAAHGYR